MSAEAATLRACNLAITLETLQMAGASPWLGVTSGLSSDQVQLVLSRRFEPGTPVSIGIDDGSGSPHTCLARITAIEPADPGWRLTCRLARPLDAQELAALLQASTPPIASRETVAEVATGKDKRTRVDLAGVRERLGRLGKQ
jgi:hypothetical protein